MRETERDPVTESVLPNWGNVLDHLKRLWAWGVAAGAALSVLHSPEGKKERDLKAGLYRSHVLWLV